MTLSLRAHLPRPDGAADTQQFPRLLVVSLHLFLYYFNDLITVALKSLFFLAFIDYFISWLLVILPSFAHLIIFIVC